MINAQEVLDHLKQGNERARSGRPGSSLATALEHGQLQSPQVPVAAVLTCSDSRVAPELLFAAGPGELFVVRVAGNVACAPSIASVEFAVAKLGVKLVLVIGHQDCGAVSAAVRGEGMGRHLDELVALIQPAIDAAPGSDDGIARQNAGLQAQRLVSESPIVRDAVRNQDALVVPAFASLSTGEVQFADPD